MFSDGKMADPIELQLYLAGLVTLILIGISAYRVIQNLKTEGRNSTIFFMLIWIFSLILVVLGLAGKYAPQGSSIAEVLLRLADSFSILILLMMTFFANSILYGTIYKKNKALLITAYAIIESLVIIIMFWLLPITFAGGVPYNEISYLFHEIITIAYFPLILPILYVFIKMEKIDLINKWKYRLYLSGFIGAIIMLAFDMPGTFPELLFVWRCFGLVGLIILIIALLLPRTEE